MKNKPSEELQLALEQIKHQEKQLKEFNEAFQTQLKGKQDIIDNLTKQLATLKAENDARKAKAQEYCNDINQLTLERDQLRSALAEREKRLCIDPGGGDKIDELESSIEFLRARIADLEKLCSEAAEAIRSSGHTGNGGEGCPTCSIYPRLQSVHSGSEK